ncbi:MAG: type I-C CRISPR-associated protein Cas5 [Deltaproteobacteria bacterium]|nr:type I-C CRISPR-associated protein Cas5 [Deltaproteobacteria bacterium]
MLDKEILRVKVEGKYACFTRPDLKVERMTYPCMTPSAARGILDCILWKPEFQWWVHRILVLNPVKFISVRRNELSEKQSKNPIIIEDKRQQRHSIILKDVAYIIEASIYQKILDVNNPPKKYVEIFRRRVRKGQCWRRPFLGTREFAAEFSEPTGTEQPISDTLPIGSMLFDIYYNDKGKPSPLFFYDVKIEKGVLECPQKENEKMMQSTHKRPTIDENVSYAIYEFNQNEEKEEK